MEGESGFPSKQEAKVKELPLEDRTANVLRDLSRSAGPIRRFQIGRAIKDLEAGNLERARRIIGGEALRLDEHAMVADHYAQVLGHDSGSVPNAWDRAGLFSGLSTELSARLDTQNPTSTPQEPGTPNSQP